MKKKTRIACYLLIFATLFFVTVSSLAFATEEENTATEEQSTVTTVDDIQAEKGVSFLETVGAVITLDYRTLGKLLVETLCKIITPAGDGFLDMISATIGEVATIDGAVYNRIEKVNIDFFSSKDDITTYYNEDGTLAEGIRSAPLRVTMGPVVNLMYSMFQKIAFIVLLVILVYIGIKIMLTSTAEKKASYKSVFVAWVMGVVMLAFFPYVMKYTIQLNNALCTWIGGEESSEPKRVTELSPLTYGTNEFVKLMMKDGEDLNKNAMMYVRAYGANNYNLPLLIIYLILIGQLLAILIMYYKRVFMVAFLIAIFPLVAMIYPLNRIGDVRMNPFGTWLKEFVVNVFVQSFHAATYRVVVSLGIASYMNSGNWLFMIMCILFLFEGEKIIRAIFNAKSSMNSIGDMAMAGAMAMNVMKSAGNLLPDLSKEKEDKSEDADSKAKSDRILASTQKAPGTASNLAAARGISGGMAEGGSAGDGSGTATDVGTFSGTPMDTGSTSGSATTTASGVQLGRAPKVDTSTPFTTTASQVKATRKELGFGDTGSKIAKVAGTAFNGVAQATGATVGMTYGLAQSDAQAAVAGLAAGASTGARIGKAGKNLLEGAVNKYADVQAARVLADEYEHGEHDVELGIDGMEKERKEAMREAYAKLAAKTGSKGSKEGAQLRFIKDRIDIEKRFK